VEQWPHANKRRHSRERVQ